MSNVSITGHANWSTYNLFLIVSFLSQSIYDPNSLRPNPNSQKLMSSSCRVHGLGWILTPLIAYQTIGRKKKKFWIFVPNSSKVTCLIHVFKYLFLSFKHLGGVWFIFSNNNFQFLNNISRISMHFFTHTYFHKCF